MDYQDWARLLVAAAKSENTQEAVEAVLKLEVECHASGESVVGEMTSEEGPLELRCPRCKEGWLEFKAK